MAGRATARDGLQHLVERWPSLALPLRASLQRFQGREEPEMTLLPFLVSKDLLAVDVGANRGVYTWQLAKLARSVMAVEANPSYLAYLSRIQPERVRVVHAALSNAEGTIALKVPRRGPHSGGLGTIEPANHGSGADWDSLQVPMRTLTDLVGPEKVGFIKIDVEGHELAVLEGASEVLVRDAPALLVEAENRHRPKAVESLFSYLEGLGYVGLMLVDGRLVSATGFQADVHQSALTDAEALDHGHRPATYVNNFLFLRA